MLQRVLCVLCAVLLVGMLATGCGKKEPETTTTIKTVEEYRDEVKDITEDNAAAELEKIQKELEAETEE